MSNATRKFDYVLTKSALTQTKTDKEFSRGEKTHIMTWSKD